MASPGNNGIYCRRSSSENDDKPRTQSSTRGSKPYPKTGKDSGKSVHHTSTAEPVDFVYDMRTRRRLREEIDNERKQLREDTMARESQLRVQNKWVAADSDKSHTNQLPRPREAWTSEPSAAAPTAAPPPRPTTRASSASTTRSSQASSSCSNRSCKGKKNRATPSIGPHVSDWQCQAGPSFSASRGELERREQTRQRRERALTQEARGVAALAAFDRQWVE